MVVWDMLSPWAKAYLKMRIYYGADYRLYFIQNDFEIVLCWLVAINQDMPMIFKRHEH